jgi:hypothetical protein
MIAFGIFTGCKNINQFQNRYRTAVVEGSLVAGQEARTEDSQILYCSERIVTKPADPEAK